LASAGTKVDEWLGRRPMPIQREAVAGVRALVLLKRLSPERYARIQASTWKKWAPVIVGLPRGNEAKGSSELAAILLDAIDPAPVEFVAAISTIIRSGAR
jgi:hypothetical protein